MTGSNPDTSNGNSGQASAGTRLLSRTLLAVIVLACVLAATLAVNVIVARGRMPELTVESLDAAENLWDAKGPASYDLDLVIEGAQPGVVHMEVRHGETTAMQRDGITPRQRRVWDVWSVPGMFDTIERELDLAADPQHEMDLAAGSRSQLRAEFDATYGYPARFQRIMFGGGPEVYWRVTRFQPK